MQFRNREDLLTRVASLYYEYDYSQQEIADRLHIHRTQISRLLKEAKQKGLVEIRIRRRIPTAPVLEQALMALFGLKQAMVVDQPESTYEERLASAGQLAAWYFEEIIRPNTVLAISWGTGVASAVAAMNDLPHAQVNVVQLIGSVGRIASVLDGPELARRLSDKLGGNYYYLHAPLFVNSRTTRDALLEQPVIAETLQRAREAQLALVGVGTTAPGASSFLRARHLTEEQVAELRAQGVVGESSGWHFDIQGKIDFDINDRVVALELRELKNIPHVVAVSCGLVKTQAIVGALRGGYLTALSTDSETAQAVLEEAARTA